MKKFMAIYHGHQTPTPEVQAAWNDWVQRRAAAEQLLNGCPFVDSVSLYEALPG